MSNPNHPDPFGRDELAWKLAIGISLTLAGLWLILQTLLEAGVIR